MGNFVQPALVVLRAVLARCVWSRETRELVPTWPLARMAPHRTRVLTHHIHPLKEEAALHEYSCAQTPLCAAALNSPSPTKAISTGIL
jgi:hypothetical protein